MYNVSETYKRVVASPDRKFVYKARIELNNGKVMDLDGHDIILNGLSVNKVTSIAGKLQVGGVNATRMDLQLNNFTHRFDGVDFNGAVITPYVGLIIMERWDDGELPEWVKMGIFKVETADVQKRVINIMAMDRMYDFDRPYKNSKLQYPATLLQILEDCCQNCGVPLVTYDFLNSDYLVHNRPNDEAVTYRDMMQWVAELAGCFARINPDGALELGWYDLEHPVADIHDVTDMWAQDVTVTGVMLRSKLEGGEDIIYGEAGYVVDLTSNPLTQADVLEYGRALARKLRKMTFRPFRQFAGLSNPALEAGDVVTIHDRDGNTHVSILSSLTYKSDAQEKYQGDAETPASKQTTRFSLVDILTASSKEETKKQISAYDTLAKQFASMTANSMGFHQTTVKQDDGSEIWYQHDKEKLEESKVIWKKSLDTMAVSTDGGKTWQGIDKNGNAVLNVLAAHGIVADWIKTGRIEAQQGGAYFDLDKGELSATKLISDKYPKYVTTIGPSEQSGGALNVTADDDCLMSVYKTFYDDNSPAGVVITAPYLTNKAGTNRKGIGIGKDSITLFADKDGYARGVTIKNDGEIKLNGNAFVMNNLGVSGDLFVQGKKTRSVPTSKGLIGVSAYETAEPYFGDIGETSTDDSGKVKIEIEALFGETVNTKDFEYQVFLQPYADGNFWVSERAANHFVVNGPANGLFAWELKAKQKGYEDARLEEIKGFNKI